MLEIMNNIGGISYYVRKYGLLVIACVCSFALAWVLLPSKVTIKEVKVIEYVKVATQTHQVAVTHNGTTTVTTDTNSISDSVTNSSSYTKEEINKKKMYVQGSYLFNREKQAFQVSLIGNVFGSVGVGAGVHYNITDKQSMGILTLQLGF